MNEIILLLNRIHFREQLKCKKIGYLPSHDDHIDKYENEIKEKMDKYNIQNVDVLEALKQKYHGNKLVSLFLIFL